MNWKERGYLFRGFQVNWKGEILTIGMAGEKYFFPKENGFTISYDECQLIARPVEDMTDEEKKIFERHKMYGDLIRTADGLLYLLSIGVLDTLVFDTEDVIFKPKNEHASNQKHNSPGSTA